MQEIGHLQVQGGSDGVERPQGGVGGAGFETTDELHGDSSGGGQVLLGQLRMFSAIPQRPAQRSSQCRTQGRVGG